MKQTSKVKCVYLYNFCTSVIYLIAARLHGYVHWPDSTQQCAWYSKTGSVYRHFAMMPCTAFITRHSQCCSLYTLHIQMLCHMLMWGKVRKTTLDARGNWFSNFL